MIPRITDDRDALREASAIIHNILLGLAPWCLVGLFAWLL